MSTPADYLLQAAYCRKMSDECRSDRARAEWLKLAGKWLALAERITEKSETGFKPVVYEGGAKRTGSD